MRVLVVLWRPVGALPDAFDASVFDLVVAADSGLDVATAAGLGVDVAVGDFDSVAPSVLEAAVASGVDVVRHPVDKDFTDGELALAIAVERGATSITVIGSRHGRLDQAMGVLESLGSPSLGEVVVDVWIDDDHVLVVRSRVELPASAGATVSLLPVGGDATGIRTSGLRFPLEGETLPVGSLRGMSNVVVDEPPSVSVSSGVLLAVLPG